ncbi:hypothetical protein C2845_PM07G33680 [Panicum miliaceum]|uniref:K+ potassium transporter integral membrane domain-containing protein n=1 Tax=Panicum miliaceum TaxID=4540 RepID=A0A3L6SNC0_PANMI|nr:hypothetical protein C2845_PM07G33680 [Panicum miliaceum]
MAEPQHTSSNGAAHGDADPQYASEKMPPKRLQRFDSLHTEAGKIPGGSTHAAKVTVLATSMVIGDGVLTPCISVLSAVGGIKQKATSLTQGQIAGIAIAILIVLFLAQCFGTDKVGYTFAPIILTWFVLIAGIGVYNLIKHDTSVLKAFNPKYVVDYFKRNGKQGWISLGGVILCITVVLFPSVPLAYIGQAAYLRIYPENVANTFYKSIPGPLYWPTFVVAVAAAIIASQAMISGAFAIIAQSQVLGCFPRVRVTHTSTNQGGDHLTEESGDTIEPSVRVQEARLSKSFSDRITTSPPNGSIDEIRIIQREMEDGVVHMLGEINVVAKPNADFFKKIIVDYAYNFMRKNFRQPENITCVPHNRLLRVGMTYEI